MIFKSKYTDRRFLSMTNRDFYDAGYEAAKLENEK
jgi:hypothetical protein